MTSSGRPLLDRTLWAALILLGVTLAVFGLTSLDLPVQDWFYNFETGRWLVDKDAPLPRLLFYTGPKVLIIVLAVAMLVLAVGPAKWRARWTLRRRDLFVVILTLASGPAMIGFLKSATNVFCPSEVRRYGGEMPYVEWCEPYPENDQPTRRGRCFPAGHASGGFALLSLAGLAATAAGRRRGVLIGLVAGWSMGLYQMLKGAHYLSHTLITMFAMWVIFLLWRFICRASDKSTLTVTT